MSKRHFLDWWNRYHDRLLVKTDIQLPMKKFGILIANTIRWPMNMDDPVMFWREQILLMGYLIGTFLGLLNLATLALSLQLQAKQFVISAVGVFGCLWMLAVIVIPVKTSYFSRAFSVVLFIYFAAVATLAEVGVGSVASAELVSVCTFSAILFGMKGALRSFIAVALTLVAFQLFLMDQFAIAGSIRLAPLRFAAWAVWVLLLSALSSISAAIMFKGLEQAVADERQLKDSLEQIVSHRTSVLNETNARLHEENTRRKAAEEEKEKRIKELQQALSEIKTLRGLLPICASCKRIRDDAGYWQEIEYYLYAHTTAELTHAICPDCLKRLYPEEATD